MTVRTFKQRTAKMLQHFCSSCLSKFNVMVLLLYMAVAKTETLASTRRYTQVNVRTLLSGGVYNKHIPCTYNTFEQVSHFTMLRLCSAEWNTVRWLRIWILKPWGTRSILPEHEDSEFDSCSKHECYQAGWHRVNETYSFREVPTFLIPRPSCLKFKASSFPQ
jgi:hypothetical protein